MLTSPDGFVGVFEASRILASVFRVVTLNVSTAFKNVPLMLACVNPLEDNVTPLTPLDAVAGLVRLNVITVSEPVLNV
jgi:hypothetical protein